MLVATYGGLHVREGGRDWPRILMSRPVGGFVWLRLLVAAIRNPVSPVGRDEVARQASPPGLSRNVQLKRLRNFVSKGLPDMPSVLRHRIVLTSQRINYRLNDCE